MLWFCDKLEIDRRYLVAAACACAQGAMHLIPAAEARPRIAVNTAIRWTQGQAPITEAIAAAAAAHAAHTTAYAAAHAAVAAAVHAFAHAAQVGAPHTSTYVSARASAAHATARRVRAVIPWSMVEKKLKERA